MDVPDKPKLDASSNLPLYHQLYHVLRNRIMSGDLQPNDQLPSERDLAATYGISRQTAHKAVGLLLSEGLVYRQCGKGVYVSPIGGELSLHLLSFSEQMKRYGLPSKSRMIAASTRPADDHLAGHLNLDVGAPVYALQRVRLLEETPLAVEWSYLPLECLPNLPDYDFSNVSLYKTLEKELDVQLDHAEQSIRARIATTEEAKLLELEKPGVVLELERETYDSFARVIEYCLCAYHPERYTLTVSLSRH